jgi:hypothetical protein
MDRETLLDATFHRFVDYLEREFKQNGTIFLKDCLELYSKEELARRAFSRYKKTLTKFRLKKSSKNALRMRCITSIDYTKFTRISIIN